jgi:hypothetical protein
VADMKTEIQKNKAEVNTQGNNNDVRVRQTWSDWIPTPTRTFIY